ncbi:hypothetical protein [Gorillibacterium timonense]|uniref:hypothetical protein n=1 Tax=Gorillibacterium timonense TaxID=1689269 RepID=UPI00071DC205|nr:hypothetical protein [Gorillibacterium timonense]
MKMKSIASFLLALVMVSTISVSSAVAESNAVPVSGEKLASRTVDDHGASLTWQKGTSGETLARVKIGKNEADYSYNNQKNRVSKKTGEQTVSYVYDSDSRLISETRNADVFTYLQENADFAGFIFRDATYAYVKDDDRNVVALKDASGQEVAKYAYSPDGTTSILGKDELGNWVDKSQDETFIGTLNLIRLHSFYYDCYC